MFHYQAAKSTMPAPTSPLIALVGGMQCLVPVTVYRSTLMRAAHVDATFLSATIISRSRLFPNTLSHDRQASRRNSYEIWWKQPPLPGRITSRSPISVILWSVAYPHLPVRWSFFPGPETEADNTRLAGQRWMYLDIAAGPFPVPP